MLDKEVVRRIAAIISAVFTEIILATTENSGHNIRISGGD